jgi:hypothetical protein
VPATSPSLLARVELHTDTSRALVLCSSRLVHGHEACPSFCLAEVEAVEENSRCRRACVRCAIVLDRHFVHQDFPPKIRGRLISALISSRTGHGRRHGGYGLSVWLSILPFLLCTVCSADTVVIACVIAIGDSHANMMTARPRSGGKAIDSLEPVGNI